jgi:phosphate transport system substrate-binding protein
VNRMTLRSAGIPAALALTLLVSACGGSNEAQSGAEGDAKLSGEIMVDGSSTVAPLSSAAGELFKEEQPDVNVSVQTSGTGGGFKKFCAGQTSISNASRPIKDEEKKLCAENQVEFAEIVVANDALTVVTNKENEFLDCLTVDELKTLWSPEATGKITKWNQVNPKFPAEEIKLFGPGTDSGTFDYFTDEINGEEGASRTDYEPSEDDNVIVQGVAGEKNALGYFGYTYFEENADKLKAVKIDGGKGCVEPSADTARDGSYTPLSRPLFIYVSKKDISRPEVKEFVTFYVENDADIAKAAQYISLNEEQKAKAKEAVASLG